MADTVPAMLEPGEYVLNRNAVKAIGKNKLDKLNFDMAPRDLLSRTDKGDFVIPAGKNIFGWPTEEMGQSELIEMIMPMGSIGKMSKTIRQLGKKGIDEYMIKPTRHEGIKKMGKLVTTGKGKKEVLDNAQLEALLMEVKKWARSRGIFEDVIKKQGGGEVPETLLSILSGGKYETSKDLPSIREQAIPALEFMTGAEHVPEGEEASLLNLALAVPFLGKFGKGAKPALSKYYASLFGSGEMSNRKIAKYLQKMFNVEAGANRKIKTARKEALRDLEQQSPSIQKMAATPVEKWGENRGTYMAERGLEGYWDINEKPFMKGLEGLLREAKDAHKYYYGKQHGGIVEDHSLMDYMMPTLDKRLGKPLKKMQFGGLAEGEDYGQYGTGAWTPGAPPTHTQLPAGLASHTWMPNYSSVFAEGATSTALPTTPEGSIGFGGGLTGTAQQTLGSALGTASAYTPPVSAEQAAQQSIQQPSASYSTSIADIFKEAGLELPDADYLEGIEAYDPTKQKRLQQDLGMKMPTLGGAGGSGFAGPTGAQIAQGEKQRDVLTQTFQRGAQDYRKDWREGVLAQIAEDFGSGTYGFEEREEDPYMG
jgi:hypothetical protein